MIKPTHSLRAIRRSGAEASISLTQKRQWFADGMMIKEGWAEALEPGIREWFALGGSRRTSQLADFYDVQSSTRDSEHLMTMGALSPDTWDEFAKTGVVPSVSLEKGYKTNFTHVTRMVELPIQVELIEDNQYGPIIDAAGNLGDSYTLKRESDAASLLNRAFNSSYTFADGKELCSALHPNGPDASGTQSNYGTLALTAANIGTVREYMQAFKDDKGNLVAVTPNELWVPPTLEDAAIVAAKSLNDPTSGNNAVNPQSMGRWTVKVWHYLTDTNAWFMADSALRKQHAKWFDRVLPNVVLDRVEKRAFAYYNARMRYSFGSRDWRWIYGNNPS